MGPTIGIIPTYIGTARPVDTTADNLDALVTAAQAGDGAATEILMARYAVLVRKLSRRYFLPGQEREDLLQEGSIGLLYGIRTYNARLDPSLHNHLARCILNHVVAAVRKATRKRQRMLNDACPLEDVAEHAAQPLDTESQAIDRLSLEDASRRIAHLLSPHERQVLTARVLGYSQNEIGGMVGLSAKQVENSLYRARTKMRLLSA